MADNPTPRNDDDANDANDESTPSSGAESNLPGFPGMPGGFPGMPGGFPAMPGGFPGMPADMGDLGKMLEQILGEASNNPEFAEVMKGMGIDPSDPATMNAMRAQMGAFLGQSDSPERGRELATDLARKLVMSSEGNDVHDDAAERDIEQAVGVATLWLDDASTLVAPTWLALGFSRAEWVEATMPRWYEIVSPVSDGVTAAITAAMRKQIGELGSEAFGDNLPEGMPAGFNPAQMLDAWAPMLGKLSSQMFSAQIGQAVGALAAEVVSGTEVGLPLTKPGLIALLPGNVSELAAALEIDAAQVRLYLAVREAARVRLFTAVPWLGPQLLSALDDYARNITIDTEGIESALSSIDPTDSEALQTALQGNLFTPTPTSAQQAALKRLETLLALAEGWVDHVTERAVAQRLPQAQALAEAVRRRRVGGAAQKTFAGLVGLELTPRRLRDAANLWAALESAGGMALRDSRWSHPDIAPTAADLDDPIGYVDRATGTADGTDAASDAESDLDAVLRDILDSAAAEGASGASDATSGAGGAKETSGTDESKENSESPETGEDEPDSDGTPDSPRQPGDA